MMFKTQKDLLPMKQAQLVEILEAYAKLGMTIPTDLKSNIAKVDYISILAKENGVPHLVTPEDLASNPDWVEQGAQVDQLVLVDLEEEKDAPVVPPTPPVEPETASGAGEKDNADVTDKTQQEPSAVGATPVQKTATETRKNDATPAESKDAKVARLISETKIRHEGHIILAVNNHVQNGRMRKDLVASAVTFTVSSEDFDNMIANLS